MLPMFLAVVDQTIVATALPAIVATMLFGVLSLRNPEAAHVFAGMVKHAKDAGAMLSAEQLAAIQDDIAIAFRAAFLLMATFSIGGFFSGADQSAAADLSRENAQSVVGIV